MPETIKIFDLGLPEGRKLDVEDARQTDDYLRGMSVSTFADYIFTVDNKKAYFKSYQTSLGFKNIASNREINEVLCYYLARQVGQPCAKYVPATYSSFRGKYNGILSFNVLKENEKILTAHRISCFEGVGFISFTSLEGVGKNIRTLEKRGYKINRPKLAEDLFRLAMFDMLTLQSDRHGGNIHFILNKDTKELRLSPLIDNELSFGIRHYAGIFDENSDFDYDGILYASRVSSMFDMNIRTCMTTPLESRIHDLCVYMCADEKFMKIAKTYMKRFDIRRAISEMRASGIKVDPKYAEYLIGITDIMKERIEKEIPLAKEDKEGLERARRTLKDFSFEKEKEEDFVF